MIDAQIQQQIDSARTVHGIPPHQHRVPFRNFRHLLSMHASADPDKIVMVHYDADGNREALTYAQFNARVHQVAGVLYDDLGIRRGDRVATIAYNHSETVILYVACWLIGAVVAPQNVTEDDQRIAFILRNSEAILCVARQEYLERAAHLITSDAEGLGAPNIRQIAQLGGDPLHNTLEIITASRTKPDTFIATDERPPPR